MGNNHPHKLSTHKWLPAQNSINQNLSYSKIKNIQNLYKSQNNELASKYVINSRQYISLEEQMEIYYYRNTCAKPLVKVYQVIPEKGKGFCSNESYLEVYQQYIPYRLCDIRNLPHEAGLYVFSQALFGFEELFQKVGSFPVDEHLIGFNYEGQTKVWYNQNFASNHNPLDGIILMGLNANKSNFDQKMALSQQQDMVQDIWLAVDKYSLFTQQFRQQSKGFIQCNFRQARSLVQNQIQKRQACIPDRIRFGQSILRQNNTNSSSQQAKNQFITSQVNQPNYNANYRQTHTSVNISPNTNANISNLNQGPIQNQVTQTGLNLNQNLSQSRQRLRTPIFQNNSSYEPSNTNNYPPFPFSYQTTATNQQNLSQNIHTNNLRNLYPSQYQYNQY